MHDMTPTTEEVRALRRKAGWTQREAAVALHVTERTFGGYERGEYAMPAALWELMRYKVADLEGAAVERN